MFRSKDFPWLTLVALISSACGSKQDPAPPLLACNSATCNPVAIVAGGATGGSSNGGSESTSGIALNVSVVEFTGTTSGSQAWSPQSVQELGGTFEVRARSVSGAALTATGPSPVELQNVVADGTGWISVKPSADSVFLPGLHLVPLDSVLSLSVPLLRVSDFDFVPALLSTKALTIDSTRAQLVLKFVDPSGAGVSGLTVSPLGGDAMAYAILQNWVDASATSAATTTDSSGRVIGINIPASPTAVSLANVNATGVNLQGVSQTVTGFFPIQAGFVTFGTLLFQ